MTFEILNEHTNTFVDITPYIAFQGLTYQRADIDSPNAGRDLAGTMHRGRVTSKDKWQCKFRILNTGDASMIFSLISPEYIQARYLSPSHGGTVISSMYVGDRTTGHCIDRSNGETLWKDLSFSCIEV